MQGFDKTIVWLLLFFYSQIIMVKTPSVLLSDDMAELGWSAMFFIYHLAGFWRVTELYGVDKVTNVRSLNKMTVGMLLWPMLVDWRQVFKRRAGKN